MLSTIVGLVTTSDLVLLLGTLIQWFPKLVVDEGIGEGKTLQELCI